MNLPSSRTSGLWLALARILTGGIWLIHAVPKFTNSAKFMPPTGAMSAYVAQGIIKSTGPYHDFLLNVVTPNLNLFAELTRLGEVAAGLLLFFGLFTRIGALIGVILPLNYLAARGGLGSLSEWASIDGCIMLLCAISLVLPTGRVLGLDALGVRRRAPHRTAVVAEVVPERPLDGPTAPP